MSEKKIGELVNSLLDGIHVISKSETIVGEPQAAGDATVIPIHRLRVAFGAGEASAGAHGEKAGGDYGGQGAGGAVELDPVAAIAVDKEGHAHILTVDSDAGTVWAALLEEVPEMVTKIAHALGERVTHRLEVAPIAAKELAEQTDAAEKPAE